MPIELPILFGPLRGLRWILRAGNTGCWLGRYEREKAEVFARSVREGDVVYDIGAHVGFYTLLASRLVGPKGSVVAFEPLARNLEYLNMHVKDNSLTNVEIIAAAVGKRTTEVDFTEGANSYTGRVSEQGDITVPMVCLDNLIERGAIPPPTLIKIDVEGGEGDVLRGARELISHSKPSIFLSTHGVPERKECVELLTAQGYSMIPLTDPPERSHEFIVKYEQNGKFSAS